MMAFLTAFHAFRHRCLAVIAALLIGIQPAVSAPSKAAQQREDEDTRIQLNVETVLYNQPQLLGAQLTSLRPSMPKQINMYFVGAGGDGTQEVFRREIEYVKKEFDEQQGTQGRSVVLANSRSSATRLPMATVTSIRQSLDAVAAKMDKSKDILFLYLTSHGSHDHVLSLEQEGMYLRGLSAPDLARLLKDTGIKWKVVVVGACYSGGFIQPLKDDHTMVITASRADRSSFGCQDENDFTYFGRAFFKDALPNATSFVDAFASAQRLIRQRESKLFAGYRAKDKARAYSDPQISNPPEIDRYLQQWWAQKGMQASHPPH